jgi:hypothetical protein
MGDNIAEADREAAPTRSPRRVGVRRFPVSFSEDMRHLDSAGFVDRQSEERLAHESKTALFYCTAAYVD